MAQDSTSVASGETAWPRVREQISISNTSADSGKFQVFEDGVEQADAKIATDIRPASILLMIDVSNSMKPDAERVMKAARNLIASAQPEDEFEIVSFSWPAYVEQEFTKDREQLDRTLANLKFEGGSTALFDAIDASIKQTNHAHGSTKRAIVLLSDGVNSSSRSSSEKSITRALKTLDSPSMYIVCTGPNGRSGLETATRISKASGGMTFTADSSDSLELDAEQIAKSVDGLGAIEYTSTHNKRDGRPHRILVRHEPALGASKTEMEYRQEYYAPSQ